MLTVSNLFMATDGYGHLKFRRVALFLVILARWLIAGFACLLVVLDNRIEASVLKPGPISDEPWWVPERLDGASA